MFPLIFWIVLYYFHPIESFELLQDIKAAAEVLGGVSSQIVPANNDSQLQEFADIFNHYINRTLLEKKNRELLSSETSDNFTRDGENQDKNKTLKWKTALNDASTEENITVDFNKLLEEIVNLYTATFASSPEDLKALYLQSLGYKGSQPNTRRFGDIDFNITEIDAPEEVNSGTADTEDIPFWDHPDDVLTHDAPTRRIFKGQTTKIKLYPFVVSILLLSSFACAGSIIKNDLVITAASCLQIAHNNRFFRENPIFIEVRVGSLYFTIGGERIPVTDVYFHPSYDPKSLHNNLAVMRLHRVLSFKRRNVKKIEFDTHASALPENTPPITIIGWGAKAESNKLYFKTRLHLAQLDYYDFQSCREIYGKKFVTRTNFCAGFISKGEGACNHDVGDPGISGRFLVGVTSFGSPNCGRPDTPTVFTKVGFYADWIQDIMEQEVPRADMRTTTAGPYNFLDKPIILYGIGSENEPIPLQREGPVQTPQDTSQVDKDLSIVMNELKKLGIQDKISEDIIGRIKYGKDHKYEELPDEERDPEIRLNRPTDGVPVHQYIGFDQQLGEENALREDSEKESEKKTTKKKWSSSEEDSSENRATRMFNFNANDRQSRERHEVKSRKPDKEIEDVTARVTTGAEINYDMGEDLPDTSDLPDTPDLPDTSDLPDVTLSPKYPVLNDKNDDTTLSIQHPITDPTAVNALLEDTPKHIFGKQPKEYVPPNILGNNHPIGLDDEAILAKYHEEPQIEFTDVDKKAARLDNNMLEQHHDPVLNKEEMPDDVADDIVKQEIQKLIEQLGISSEVSSQTEDHTFVTDSPLRDGLETKNIEKPKVANAVLTLLYVPESEKKAQPRAKLEASAEGLSIDPAPFQKNNHDSNHLIGKSEIYEIFANVMNTVVNKTFH